MAKQVIFDTDIGIDDAMALLFLHYAPDVDLRAIISGFGNADIDTTTRNALFIKERFAVPAPVFRGAAAPIGATTLPEYPDFVHGRNGLGEVDIPTVETREEETGGPEALVQLARDNPGQLSIVAVGRMTNLALALELCPELPELVRELVVMGGAFGFNGHRGNVSPVAEANIAGDPVAADRVFTSGMPVTIVGLDVTQEVILDDAGFGAIRDSAGDAGRFIHDISRFYLAFHEGLLGRVECPVHDSSAVAYLLRPDLFTTREVKVRVATEGVAAGQTIWADPGSHPGHPDWDDVPVVRICTGVDAPGMLGLYRETLALAVD